MYSELLILLVMLDMLIKCVSVSKYAYVNLTMEQVIPNLHYVPIC